MQQGKYDSKQKEAGFLCGPEYFHSLDKQHGDRDQNTCFDIESSLARGFCSSMSNMDVARTNATSLYLAYINLIGALFLEKGICNVADRPESCRSPQSFFYRTP